MQGQEKEKRSQKHLSRQKRDLQGRRWVSQRGRGDVTRQAKAQSGNITFGTGGPLTICRSPTCIDMDGAEGASLCLLWRSSHTLLLHRLGLSSRWQRVTVMDRVSGGCTLSRSWRQRSLGGGDWTECTAAQSREATRIDDPNFQPSSNGRCRQGRSGDWRLLARGRGFNHGPRDRSSFGV